MKKILLALIIFVSSCGVTNYWSDDVYYSLPAQRENGYIDLHDRYLRMKPRDTRWSQFDDDFWYWNSPRQNLILPYSIYDPYFGYNRFRNPFVPQIGWTPYPSLWYNPYANLWRNNTIYNYNPYVFKSPKTVIMPRQQPQPRTFNLNSYGSGRTGNTYVQPNTSSAPVRVFNNTTTNNRSSVTTPQTRTNSLPAQSSPRPTTNAPVRKF